MAGRWRGQSLGLAIVALLAVAFATAAVAIAARSPADEAPDRSWALVISDGDGHAIARVELPGARFALRYRNSVYRSLAEERFRISGDGRIVLVGLAADEGAVLDEYYGAASVRAAPADDARRWRGAPSDPVSLGELSLAATEHGRRTLVVDGRPAIELWRLAGRSDPGVTLRVEPVR